jgi:hypothetical protein
VTTKESERERERERERESGGSTINSNSNALTKRELSKTPAIIPATKAAQFSCPMSEGTDTNVFVIGEFS